MTQSTSHGLAPKVEAEELRECWEASRDFRGQHPGRRVLVRTQQHSFWVAYRAAMLQTLFMDPSAPLAPWCRGDDLDDSVFRVAAEFPMTTIGEGIHHGLPFDVEAFLARLKQ